MARLPFDEDEPYGVKRDVHRVLRDHGSIAASATFIVRFDADEISHLQDGHFQRSGPQMRTSGRETNHSEPRTPGVGLKCHACESGWLCENLVHPLTSGSIRLVTNMKQRIPPKQPLYKIPTARLSPDLLQRAGSSRMRADACRAAPTTTGAAPSRGTREGGSGLVLISCYGGVGAGFDVQCGCHGGGGRGRRRRADDGANSAAFGRGAASDRRAA